MTTMAGPLFFYPTILIFFNNNQGKRDRVKNQTCIDEGRHLECRHLL
jgi:hypothetical protein